ncbi:MAG: enoyl-CoA hydratase-related protein [Dehalococcoidia bacterium]|nr:enoyl-CoA hydratase-related protein [Dehalococcoidia bacterium]
MAEEPVLYQKKGGVAWITLNRPEAGNAIDLGMMSALEHTCLQANQDPDIRVVVITGAGSTAFCIGEDPALPLENTSGGGLPEDTLADFALRRNVGEIVSRIECPVVAALNGDARGAGLALALACDLRIASANASFSAGDFAHACLLANGLTQFLPRIIGRGKALEMLLTGESVSAAEALTIGLVHRVVPPQDVASEAAKMANDIAAKAPVALRYAKEAVNKGMDLTLDQALRLECDLYMILHTTHDRTEGITSFREKRKPTFKGE